MLEAGTITMTNLVLGFSNQEVMALTGVSYGALTYWKDQKIIEPLKIPIGSGKRNTYFYSFPQLVEVKAVMALRDNVQTKTIRAVKNFISENFEDPNIANKPLVALTSNDKCEVFLQGDDRYLMQITGQNVGQITHLDLILIPSLKTQINEVVEAVKSGKCETIDMKAFKARLTTKRSLSLVA
jgi:DNA-binding transcriptional MerR regulator